MAILTTVHTCIAGIQLLTQNQGCYVSKEKTPDYPKAIKVPSTHLMSALDVDDVVADKGYLKDLLYATPYNYSKYNTASANSGI